MTNSWYSALLLTVFLVLSGCASSYKGISTSDPVGDSSQLLSYGTFHMETSDLPVFLGPVIASNFSVAMAERGYQPVSSDGDAIARLTYVQTDLPVEETAESIRFIAKINVELLNARSREVLWSGSIQRLHTVNAGEYMHVGDASFSFLQAFRDLFSDLPARPIVDEN